LRKVYFILKKEKHHKSGANGTGISAELNMGSMSVREFAPSDELPTGKDGAMFRTQFAQSMNFKISKS
jgi:hypothetical protein